MIQPPFLQQGDVVALVSTARKLEAETILAAADVISSWGYTVTMRENLAVSEHSYLAGSDQTRLSDLQTALDDDRVKAIFCIRGGYGTTRILDLVKFDKFLKSPKWIAGFSDLTSLHMALQRLNVQSIHSAMPVFFARPEAKDSNESLRKLIAGEWSSIHWTSNPLNRPGTGSGQLVGGNLSLLVDSLGTPSALTTTNKLLVIEEIDEPFYKVDRMFVQLKRAGLLRDLAGLILGHFTAIRESTVPFSESLEQIVRNHTNEFAYPVTFGFPSGHEEPNLAWVQGASAILAVGENGTELRYVSDSTKP